METNVSTSGNVADKIKDELNSTRIVKNRKYRKLKNVLAKYSIGFGGLSVIAALLLIFVYLLLEVTPLFMSPDTEKKTTFANTYSDATYLSMEEQGEISYTFTKQGNVSFIDNKSGNEINSFPISSDSSLQVTSLNKLTIDSHNYVVGFNNGTFLYLSVKFKVTYPNDVRVITPSLKYPLGDTPLSFEQVQTDASFTHIAASDGEEQMTVAAVTDKGQLLVTRYYKEEDLFSDEVALEAAPLALDYTNIEDDVLNIYFDPDQFWLFTVHASGKINVFDVRSEAGKLHEQVDATNSQDKITASAQLLGGISLLVGTSEGEISQWFMARDDKNIYHFSKIRAFEGDSPVTTIEPEHRRKGFIAGFEDGTFSIYHTTANRHLASVKVGDSPIVDLGISPRAKDMLVQDANGKLTTYKLHNEHPDVSWEALWSEIWYENYDEEKYIWQSSSSSNDFEPKISLMPLAFGTLKAAFYAMLIATPLAVAGAVYTAYFMAPALRRKIKPIIELMEALPTVILGFLAGLWLAPMVEDNLASIFTLLLLLPISILATAFAWSRMPKKIQWLLPDGWDMLLLIPVIIATTWFAFWIGGPIETGLFDGSLREYLENDLGIPYDQRNALIVGLAMGFAVIPTIFSISEDAIFSVPKSLTYGSLALGATPWQTLVRVVLPTASPGIFSGLMIGLGRAVGETMIVLMATGNTPIMDMNIFEGMRTLAANIAVEMPEAEVDSTHYRVLFLAAFVLFLFTFVVNTFAEQVRHRLRKKYGSL